MYFAYLLYGIIDYVLLIKTRVIQEPKLEDDSFDSSDSQYDTDKEIEKKKNSEAEINENAKESSKSKGQSFKEWATEQMGMKLKNNQNKSIIDESNTISQVKLTKSQKETKSINKKVLIQDGIDITENSDDYKFDVKKSEAKSVKKVLRIPKNIQICP